MVTFSVSKKLNVYGNYYFNSWGGWNVFDANRRFTNSSLIGASQATNNFTNSNGNGHSYKVGADYYFGKNHVFSMMYRGNFGFNNTADLGSTSFRNINQQIDSSLQTVSERSNNWHNKTLNVNYKCDIDSTGQSLTFDADYATFNFNSESKQASKNYDSFGNNVNRDINLKSILDGNIRIVTAKQIIFDLLVSFSLVHEKNYIAI